MGVPQHQLRIRDVLAWAADEDLEAFTLDDLVARFGVPRKTARELGYRLAAGNYAHRLKHGLYMPLPPNHWKRPETPLVANWHLVAKHLAAPDPYFLAYYTAMELHQMIQHPLNTVFVATTGRKIDIQVGPITIRFVRLVEAKFTFGHEPLQMQRGKVVEVADLERTFLDAVDRPELCGGIEEVTRGFARRHDDLKRDRLLRYVVELDQPVATKRLGYLLGIAGHADPRLLRELERRARRLKTYTRLVPGGGDVVERSKRWELDINVDPDRLIDAVTT
jgi:predicted transcriptional regulator of viral defense system